METTNDGFTFRRVSTNKVEHVRVGLETAKPQTAKGAAFKMDGFTFRKVKVERRPEVNRRNDSGRRRCKDEPYRYAESNGSTSVDHKEMGDTENKTSDITSEMKNNRG
ncbi:hypothetical protein PAEPH01_2906, partial [Pancytospora epiphaga]